jgi:hypothetical protein
MGIQLNRREGWEGVFEKYIKDSVSVPFQWGVCDCVLWAGEWFRLLTGADVTEDIRGKYDSKESAAALIESKGGLVDGITERIPQRVIGFQKRGDLALCIIDGQETLGIIGACNFVFFKMEKGVYAKRIKPTAAWGVD